MGNPIFLNVGSKNTNYLLVKNNVLSRVNFTWDMSTGVKYCEAYNYLFQKMLLLVTMLLRIRI